MAPCACLHAVVLMMCSLIGFTAAQEPQELDLRLVDGSTNMEGRLEIFFQGAWGTVCKDAFEIEEASVVCHQLGFQYALEVKSFGPGEGMIVLDDLNCNGDEASILDCYHEVLGKADCGYAIGIGVVCSNAPNTEIPVTHPPDTEALLRSGTFRLVDGPDPYHGRVEVFVYNARAWMPICSEGWDFSRASFVCEKLGFRPATVAGTGRYGVGTGQTANCSDGAFNYPYKVDFNFDNCQALNESDATEACSHDMAVDVSCDGREPGIQHYLRFEGGSQQSEGLVEIYNNNVWRGLCSDSWTMADATVACQQQGLPPPTEVVAGGTFGSSRAGDILQVSLDCTGEEYSLAACPQTPRQTPCAQGDAALRCGDPGEPQEFDLRLANGGSTLQGRVEIFYQGEWGTVCHSLYGDLHEATVACRQLGFKYAERRTKEFGQGTGTIVLDGLICNGNEERLVDCHHRKLGDVNCDHRDDIGMVCSNIDEFLPPPTPRDGDLRLADGPDPYQGRVEVFLAEEDTWATVCNQNWDFGKAEDVCRHLDYRPATFTGRGVYGVGTGPIATCPVSFFSLDTNNCQLVDTCTHDMDVFVVCNGKEPGSDGEVKLVDGSEPTEGRIEIFHHNAWKTLCAENSSYIVQQIACRHLALPFPVKEMPGGRFGDSLTYKAEDIDCGIVDRRVNLKFCDYTPRETACVSGHVAVQCGIWKNATEGDVRLAGGFKETAGRVEIFHNGTWGKVCDDGLFGRKDGDVVCHQLGYRNMYWDDADTRHLTTRGTLAWLRNPMCKGYEGRVTDCPAVLGELIECTTSFAELECENQPYASSYEARIVGGPYPNQGRVELLYNGAWQTVCDDEWDRIDAEVVCRQLGFSKAVVALDGGDTASLYGSGTGGILLYKLECLGTEESIVKCRYEYPFEGLCGHHEDIGVVCFSEEYPSDDPRPKDDNTLDGGLSSSMIRNIVVGCLVGCNVLLAICFGGYKWHKKQNEPQIVMMGPNEGFTGSGSAAQGQYAAVSQDGPPSYEDAANNPEKYPPAEGKPEDPSAPPATQTTDV